MTVWFAMQVACISAGPSEEVFSFSFGGADGNLVAAGCKSQVFMVILSHSCRLLLTTKRVGIGIY